MEDVLIRLATPYDLHTLRELGIRTFTESFSEFNTEEDMSLYLREAFSAEKTTGDLENPEVRFLIAETEGIAVGYVKLNSGAAQSEPMGEDSVEIERVYVAKAFQNRGIGKRLLDAGVSTARSQGAFVVWLGVWEHNPGAMRFYGRNGFTAFGKHPFMLGNDLQTDILMKLSIVQTEKGKGSLH